MEYFFNNLSKLCVEAYENLLSQPCFNMYSKHPVLLYHIDADSWHAPIFSLIFKIIRINTHNSLELIEKFGNQGHGECHDFINQKTGKYFESGIYINLNRIQLIFPSNRLLVECEQVVQNLLNPNKTGWQQIKHINFPNIHIFWGNENFKTWYWFWAKFTPEQGSLYSHLLGCLQTKFELSEQLEYHKDMNHECDRWCYYTDSSDTYETKSYVFLFINPESLEKVQTLFHFNLNFTIDNFASEKMLLRKKPRYLEQIKKYFKN